MTSDEQEIRNLLFVYAERIDRGDLTGMARLFQHAEYGTGDQPPTRDWREVERRNRELVRIHEDGTPGTQHVTSNVQIELDETGTAATTRSTFTVFQGVAGGPIQPIVLGRYHDRFVRVDGQWRFAARRILIDRVGDLTQHLRLDAPSLLDAGRAGQRRDSRE